MSPPLEFRVPLLLGVLFLGGLIYLLYKSVSVFTYIFKFLKAGPSTWQAPGPFSPRLLNIWEEYEETIEGLRIPYRWGGSRRGAGYFLWQIPTQANGEFLITERRPAPGILSILDTGGRFELGDADFDQKFRIESESPDFALSYFSSSDRKEAVKKLFSMGFYDLRLKKDSMEIKINPSFGYAYDPDLSSEAAQERIRFAREYFSNPLNVLKAFSEAVGQLKPASPEQLQAYARQREQFLKDAVKEIRRLL